LEGFEHFAMKAYFLCGNDSPEKGIRASMSRRKRHIII